MFNKELPLQIILKFHHNYWKFIDNSLLSYIHTFKIIAYFSKKYNKILYFNPFFLFKRQFIV